MNRAEKNVTKARALERAYNALMDAVEQYERDAARYKEQAGEENAPDYYEKEAWDAEETAAIYRDVAETILTKLS